MSGRATYTTAAAILYTDLAAGVLGEKRCPYRRVSVDDVIRYCKHDCVVTVIEGSEPVVSAPVFFSSSYIMIVSPYSKMFRPIKSFHANYIPQVSPVLIPAITVKFITPPLPKYTAKHVFGINSHPQNKTEIINRRVVLVNNNGPLLILSV